MYLLVLLPSWPDLQRNTCRKWCGLAVAGQGSEGTLGVSGCLLACSLVAKQGTGKLKGTRMEALLSNA